MSNANATHTQHLRQELLRKIKLARMGAIARHQEPASEPCLDDMEAHARGHLRELTHEHVEVAHQYLLQDGAALERASELYRVNPQGGSGALHQRAQRSVTHTHKQRNPEKAFRTDEAQFKPGASFN